MICEFCDIGFYDVIIICCWNWFEYGVKSCMRVIKMVDVFCILYDNYVCGYSGWYVFFEYF